MTKKPPKHSERKKRESSAYRLKRSWGAGRTDAPTVRIRPERFLIVIEGTRTEPAYFEGFRKRVTNSYGGNYITIEIHGAGFNTVSLFERARLLSQSDIAGFTQVWIVYDKDSFPAQDFNAVADLCNAVSRGGTRFRAAWTNEAFELWFLLHYAYVESGLSRNAYGPKLSSHLQSDGKGSYRKNRADMYEILEGRLGNAVANAERLEEVNAVRTSFECNPGTTVHHLVKELLPYIRSSAENDGE